ncbi:hypothetical protein Pan216_35510 [Planctomycetes bacterium Pan216]|uniref:Teneurin-like YD-shell domain-containing protein n=1 Tax=Kolteria novifilia TaxID=2527975 RepID=A0A518B6T5_9BACT|nr:hypothetical protein Pan216_35510 [Planctomycetes bacterium Pan216]
MGSGDRERPAVTSGNGVAEKRVDFAYNAIDQITQIDRYADLGGTQLVATTTAQFDTLGRITDLTHTNSTQTVDDLDFTFDNLHRITQIISDDGTADYTYDDYGQLLTATYTYQSNETYTYDLSGNVSVATVGWVAVGLGWLALVCREAEDARSQRGEGSVLAAGRSSARGERAERSEILPGGSSPSVLRAPREVASSKPH